jgi:ADP-ribose pyrophosphatase YjhB (NUDIX family)
MSNIRIGAAGIVQHNNKILLGRRNKDPNRGLYILPGGGVDLYEDLTSALKREIQEESNLMIEQPIFFKYYELIRPDAEHRIIFYFSCETLDISKLVSSDDIYDAAFFSKEDILLLLEKGEVSSFVAKVLNDWYSH